MSEESKKILSRRKFVVLTGGALAASGILAACGDATNTAAPAPAATTAATSATTAATSATTAAGTSTTTTAAGATTAAAGAATAAGDTSGVATKQATIILYGGAGLKDFYTALATAFHTKYPAITVTPRLEADNSYSTVLPRTLASDNAPDLAATYDSLVNNVKDKLLTNLDSYNKQYGWDTRVSKIIVDAGRVSDQGVRGSGSLYLAGGAAGSAVGVFFNKDVAAKVGLTDPPKTLADFEAILAKAKAAGVTPIIAANKDGLILHIACLLLGNYMGIEATNAFNYRAAGATINTPQALEAMKLLQKWIQAGYFNSDTNALDQQASYGQFGAGKGLFTFQGSWVLQVLDKSFAGKYGFFPMPPKDANTKYTALSHGELGFSIPEKSKNKDAAALFLDWLTTPEAAQIAVKNGYFAATGTEAVPPAPLSSPVTDQLQAEYQLVAASNGFHSWQVDASPSLAPVFVSELQLLAAGKETPDGMLAKIQSTYSSDKK